jgi:hypothetical protein
MDKLDYIFQMQKDLEKYVTTSRYPKKLEDRISALSVAIIHEAVEPKINKLEVVENTSRF